MTEMYRFYIGRKVNGRLVHSHTKIVHRVKQMLGGATFYDATGIWEGVTEPTTVVELVGGYERSHMEDHARLFAEIFHQDAVMMTCMPVAVSFVAPKTRTIHPALQEVPKHELIQPDTV